MYQMSRPEFDFDALRELHDSVNRLLHSPDTKLEIIHHGREKWANEVSEASLKMADSCAAAKDLLLLAKEHLQSLQFAFRRIAATATETARGSRWEPFRALSRPAEAAEEGDSEEIELAQGDEEHVPCCRLRLRLRRLITGAREPKPSGGC
ncbi:hypothetical protein Salat_0629700 [Sesamum alatum]|uniref:Uncharacterized protein n=1 Tax=Sesamum alatum TaxID=300844 RepID=A0AAE1YQF2_9LAMI|nr:hypothetical protein Salat_0629700 [Sesamum alatum]